MSLYNDMLTIFTAYAGKINQLKDDLGDLQNEVLGIDELVGTGDVDDDD